MGHMQQEQQQKHYFDSIDTDEFVMPNMFEVEIRLADNQVRIKCASNIYLFILWYRSK